MYIVTIFWIKLNFLFNRFYFILFYIYYNKWQNLKVQDDQERVLVKVHEDQERVFVKVQDDQDDQERVLDQVKDLEDRKVFVKVPGN